MSRVENNLIKVGYSIRERIGVHLPFHKPSCKIISYDPNINAPHPDLELPGWESVSGFVNTVSGLRYSYKIVKDIYGKITDRNKYSIFSYAIAQEDIRAYSTITFSGKNDKKTPYGTFDYALIDPKTIDESLIGFDIIDIEIGDLSALLNCEVHWKDAEECGELNDFHLFQNLPDAVSFKKMANRVIPEHAPFAVWAISQVS